MQRKVFILGTSGPGNHSFYNLNTNKFSTYCDFTQIVHTFAQLKFVEIPVKYLNSLLK